MYRAIATPTPPQFCAKLAKAGKISAFLRRNDDHGLAALILSDSLSIPTYRIFRAAA